MQLVTREVQYKGDPTFTIYGLGDQHEGTIHHDRSRWLADVQRVADDPYALWLGMGDAEECIVMSDPRFEAGEVDSRFVDKLQTLAIAQRDSFIETVRPIADKCIGLHEGNHEFELKRRHYVDLTLDACRELGTEYLTDTAMIRLVFRNIDGEDGHRLHSSNLIIYSEHGNAGGTQPGASANYMERLMGAFDADLYLSGHNHKRLVVPKVNMAIPSQGKPRLLQRRRLGVFTGSYYRTYEAGSSSYGQRKSYPAADLGCVPVRFRPNTGHLDATL